MKASTTAKITAIALAVSLAAPLGAMARHRRFTTARRRHPHRRRCITPRCAIRRRGPTARRRIIAHRVRTVVKGRR